MLIHPCIFTSAETLTDDFNMLYRIPSTMQQRLPHKDNLFVHIDTIHILRYMLYCLQCFGCQQWFNIFIRIQSPNPIGSNITIFKCPIEMSGIILELMLIDYGTHALRNSTSIVRTERVNHDYLIRYRLCGTDTPFDMHLLIECENDYCYRIIHL